MSKQVRLAEAIVKREFVKTEMEEFAASLRATGYYPGSIEPVIREYIRQIRLRENNTAMLLFGVHL